VDREGVGPTPADALATSATMGVGVDVLAGAIARLVSGDGPREGELVLASQRQGDRLRQVAVACVAARDALAVAGPAAAAALVTDALAALGELTGVGAQEAVLDEVFARFCVGK